MNRHLCRGKRLDNGEWETGSHVVTSQNLSNERHYIADKMTGYLTPIDPTTVEPVKVRPVLKYGVTYYCPPDCGGHEYDEYGDIPHCPNCDKKLQAKTNFCPYCGQALNWAEESMGGFDE